MHLYRLAPLLIILIDFQGHFSYCNLLQFQYLENYTTN